MEQRPLRLGDLVDDYCPRERRITNHVIAAIVNDAIRQTRCTACESEHPYKAAKAPLRRLKDPAAEAPPAGASPVLASPPQEPPAALVASDRDTPAGPDAGAQAGAQADAVPEAERDHDDTWAVRRPLIRATLPKTENDLPPPRPIPEFTMHQRHTRGSHSFRHGSGWPDRGGGGGGGGPRRHGWPSGDGQGNGNGRGQGPGHGYGQGPRDPRSGQGNDRGRKRSR